MKTISRALRVRALGAPLTAFAALLLVGISVPNACADTPAALSDTVLVPRITKGAHGTSMRVKRDSSEARLFFAAQSGARTQTKTKFCPGTICPQTRTCTATKGALGAGCITG